jgi:hypothetical protein
MSDSDKCRIRTNAGSGQKAGPGGGGVMGRMDGFKELAAAGAVRRYIFL